MGAYVVRRLLGMIPVLVLVALTSFMLIHLVPGDPAMVMLGNEATPDQLQALRAQLGLDRPLTTQFVLWVSQILKGNMGESFFLSRPVTQALCSEAKKSAASAISRGRPFRPRGCSGRMVS